jgi:hypothetical protein
MIDVLSWNQMDHDKISLCESHLYVCDSATPSLSALVYMTCYLVHPNLRIPSQRVPSLKLFSDPRLPVGSQDVNVHWCNPVHVTLVVLLSHSILECQEKQTLVPRPFLGLGQSVAIHRLRGLIHSFYSI